MRNIITHCDVSSLSRRKKSPPGAFIMHLHFMVTVLRLSQIVFDNWTLRTTYYCNSLLLFHCSALLTVEWPCAALALYQAYIAPNCELRCTMTQKHIFSAAPGVLNWNCRQVVRHIQLNWRFVLGRSKSTSDMTLKTPGAAETRALGRSAKLHYCDCRPAAVGPPLSRSPIVRPGGANESHRWLFSDS